MTTENELIERRVAQRREPNPHGCSLIWQNRRTGQDRRKGEPRCNYLEGCTHKERCSLAGVCILPIVDAPAPDDAELIRWLQQMALPDPHDEREVLHANKYKQIAARLAAIARERDELKERWQRIRDTLAVSSTEEERALRERAELAESRLAEATKGLWKCSAARIYRKDEIEAVEMQNRNWHSPIVTEKYNALPEEFKVKR